MLYTQFYIFSLALFFYGSAIWGGIFFFKAEDENAKKGKIVIGLSSITSTVVALSNILNEKTPEILIQILFVFILYVIAIFIFWISIFSNKKNPLSFAFSSEKPIHFIKECIYKKIRHPFYSSYLLGWIAPVIYTQNSYTIISLILMTTIYVYSAKLEEKKFLLSDFSDEYKIYMHSTGMFFPRVM